MINKGLSAIITKKKKADHMLGSSSRSRYSIRANSPTANTIEQNSPYCRTKIRGKSILNICNLENQP